MTLSPTVGHEQLALVDLVERLVTEYEGVVPAGTVMRCVARCRDEVDGVAPAQRVPAVERLARAALAAPVR